MRLAGLLALLLITACSSPPITTWQGPVTFGEVTLDLRIRYLDEAGAVRGSAFVAQGDGYAPLGPLDGTRDGVALTFTVTVTQLPGLPIPLVLGTLAFDGRIDANTLAGDVVLRLPNESELDGTFAFTRVRW